MNVRWALTAPWNLPAPARANRGNAPRQQRQGLLAPAETALRLRARQRFQADPFRMLTDQELRDLFPACQELSHAGAGHPQHDGEIR